jgi:hypothetical protein
MAREMGPTPMRLSPLVALAVRGAKITTMNNPITPVHLNMFHLLE